MLSGVEGMRFLSKVYARPCVLTPWEQKIMRSNEPTYAVKLVDSCGRVTQIMRLSGKNHWDEWTKTIECFSKSFNSFRIFTQ
jgi:hypothetical protein